MDDVETLLADNPIECGTCSFCCQNNPGIFVLKEFGDDPSLYEGFLDYVGEHAILKTKANGDCIFLDRKTGCTAYETRPSSCRAFECRRDYLTWVGKPRQERRELQKQGTLNKSVQQQGRRLLKKILKETGDSLPTA